MAYTAYKVASGVGAGGLSTAVTTAISEGWQPVGEVITQENSAYLLQVVAQGSANSDAASYTLPAATSSVIGGVKKAAYVTNAGASTATDVATLVSDVNALATKFNSVLTAMQNAGQMSGS